MTKEELLTKLKAYAESSKSDPEAAHGDADQALIDFINDEEIRVVYDSIEKMYA